MTLLKRLAEVSLIGSLILGQSSCGEDNLKYHFRGKIGNEQVVFYESNWGKYNRLIVTKSNGDIWEFLDENNDLEMDIVKITENGKLPMYHDRNSPTANSKEIAYQAKKYFKFYLQEIQREKNKV